MSELKPGILELIESGQISLGCGPVRITPWTEEEREQLRQAFVEMFEEEKKEGFMTEEGEWTEKGLNYMNRIDK